jgi:putative oxidoreductase
MKSKSWLGSIPSNRDAGLLVLRVWMGISLFVMHGIEKLFHFHNMIGHFPDPLHVGALTGLIFATLSDGISSLLVMLGLATRLSALIIVINLLVVFAFMHGFSFQQDHAQLVYVYLGGYLAILLAGPGKFSLDHLLSR